jgi:hypothetical protein
MLVPSPHRATVSIWTLIALVVILLAYCVPHSRIPGIR